MVGRLYMEPEKGDKQIKVTSKEVAAGRGQSVGLTRNVGLPGTGAVGVSKRRYLAVTAGIDRTAGLDHGIWMTFRLQ